MSEASPGGIIIFGATGGIGSALARRLCKAGWPLTLAGRDEDKLSELAADLAKPHTARFEATDADSIEAAVKSAIEHHDRIAGAVYLPGTLILKPAHATKVEEYRETMAVNVDGAFAMLRAIAQPMCKAGGGSVVFASSAVGRLGFAAHEAIAAAKGALQGLALSAAASYAARGLRVNVVAPGSTDTPLAKPITSNESVLKASLAMHPDGKLGTPDAVASAIQWLLHPDQWHVTGQIIGIDGGLATVRSK